MLWLKTTHLLFVMAWVASVFYLPRIFVHYVEGVAEGEDVRRLVTMAGKLLRFGALMALIAMASGTWLWLGWGFTGRWLIAKLVFVGLLVAFHLQCGSYVKRMRAGETLRSSLYFRIFNESALLIVIPILIMVIVKPF